LSDMVEDLSLRSAEAKRRHGPQSITTDFARIIGVIAAVHFALFGYFLFRTAIGSPISDMFGYIDAYLRFRAGETSLPHYLWRAHGEHHLLWIRLFTWADVELFHTRGIPFMAAATAAIAATAALIWQQLRRAEPALGGATSLALLAPMLILGSANVTDASVPINTTYPLTAFFVIVALVLFARAGEASSPTRYRLAAMLAALGASLATAAGLLAWPILLWMAWRERLSWRWLVTLAAVGGAYGLVYAQGLYLLGLAPALAKDAASFLSAAHLGKLLDYFFAFLGLPLTRAAGLGPIGRVIGAALFAAGLFAMLVASLSRHLSTPLDRIAIGMVLLAFGSAALAALGRADLADEVAVPVRYTLFATALQVGLLCLVLPRVVRYGERSRLLASAGGLVVAVALLVQQVVVGRAAVEIVDAIAQEADCFAQGAHAGEVSKVVTRAPADAQAVLAALRQQGLLASRPACRR
jgi:MFS family permease